MEQAAGLIGLFLTLAIPAADRAPATPPAEAAAARRAEPMELEVPFACGSRIVISQAHNTFSHVGTDTWAWDFRVPVGTPVLAARDGVVRLVRSDSVRGGCDRSFGPDANYVILAHGDGLETQYLHFSKVFVQLGQKVRAGTALGEVGETGFSCGSHLHFQLQRTKPQVWAGQSVPARFRAIGDPEVEQVVTSGNCPAMARQPLQASAAGGEMPAKGEAASLGGAR